MLCLHQTSDSAMPAPLALCYHAVRDVTRDEDPYNLAVSPDRLRRHITSLRRWGYRLVTFGDFTTAATAGDADGLAALTFDDGYDDNLDILVPILQELEVPATVFVTAGLLGGRHPDVDDWPIMNEDQVVALAAAGVEIGCHGWSHPDMTQTTDLTDELHTSRDRLEQLVGAPVDTFAFPYGRADDRVIEATREAGYRAACLTSGNGDWTDPLRTPRQDGTRGMSIPGLWLRTREQYEPLVSTIPGRIARRAVHEVTLRRG